MATKVLVKNGKLATYGGKVVEVEASGAEAIEWHQCPEAVQNYLANVTYDSSNYTSSLIETYATEDVQSNPIGVQAGGVMHYNEEPNVETPWAAGEKAGTLKPLDTVRWIKSPTRNVRDLGGWPCDGGAVRYGKLFRGGEVAASDTEFVTTLHDEVGIRAELELQGTGVAEDYSVIGSDVDFCCPTDGGVYWAYYSIASKTSMQQAFRFIFDSVGRGRPLYFHCSAGADRTGTIACLIEALLGMSQGDIDRDYELTSFNGSTYLRKRCGREYASGQWEYGYKNLITAITALSGATFRDKVVNYIASLGFTCGYDRWYACGSIACRGDVHGQQDREWSRNQQQRNKRNAISTVHGGDCADQREGHQQCQGNDGRAGRHSGCICRAENDQAARGDKNAEKLHDRQC